MILFKILYYGFGLMLAIVELISIGKSKDFAEKLSDYMALSKHKKDNNEKLVWNDVPSDVKGLLVYKFVFVILSMIWLALGIFTFNWAFFLSYMVFVYLFGKLFKPFYPSAHLLSFMSLVFIAFVFFVTVNSFHLHIDFFSLFK